MNECFTETQKGQHVELYLSQGQFVGNYLLVALLLVLVLRACKRTFDTTNLSC